MNKPLRIVPILILFTAALSATDGFAEVRLPSCVSDHMVLQRDLAVPIWGWADAGETVTVTMADRSQSTTADGDGRWSVRLKKLSAGGPHTLRVTGSNTITIDDVLVGEVWVCSGQSNMAMAVRSSANAEEEIASANYPQIRMFTAQRTPAVEPAEDVSGSWAVCSPDTVGGFSATAFYFGRKLHGELDVPIGLLHSSWGGTAVEAWTSLPAQRTVDELRPVLDAWDEPAEWDEEQALAEYAQKVTAWEQRAERLKQEGKKAPRKPSPPTNPALNQNRPANLFNGMLHPLIPYGIRGAIWYQGERNAKGTAHLYQTQLPTLIADWRSRWGQGEFPFLWVQLPNFKTPQTVPVENDPWVIVQEGMFKTLSVPNTGMAITIDVGEAKNIHPKNKQAVGLRLATWALAKTYGRSHVPSGPLYKRARFDGPKAILRFDHVGAGLMAKGGKLRGFAIAGDDGDFVKARAQIVGDTIEVWSEEITNPAAVRYAWAPNPDCNLYNQDGLPASPFRTDNWPLNTSATP